MNQPESTFIIGTNDPILVTGATGFIGRKVVQCLLERGFQRVRCLVRPSSERSKIEALTDGGLPDTHIEVFEGNLLSREDCGAATDGVAVILHLAAGTGTKSFADAFMNSVVTTRNLIEAAAQHRRLKRFVSVSSFTVYDNAQRRNGQLDESCPVEVRPARRGEAYCYAKVKQDQLVTEKCNEFGIPFVIVRPGYVYGPGRAAISSRVGLDTFGMFLHLGGSNTIPFTFVDNCAEAIALAGLVPGIDGEVFNVVDDDLPTSRQFLRQYKRNVRTFRSLYVPHGVSYWLCSMWERYSEWSKGQLPLDFNRKRWHAYWKRTKYSNAKLKARLGWKPRVQTTEGFRLYFESCKETLHAG
jgi:nucleoside-diphosphate-sugar epimerase